ncbi:MAG TPA: hypothetical protein VF221_21260 [Chloroflexota bacterium]
MPAFHTTGLSTQPNAMMHMHTWRTPRTLLAGCTISALGLAAVILPLSIGARNGWARTPSSQGATVIPTTSGASLARSEALVQAYVGAFNGRDVNGVLSTFETNFKYWDCDYASARLVLLRTKEQLRWWLRTLFEEHDMFQQVRVTGRNPREVGFLSVHTNSVIRALGVPSIDQNPKFRVDAHAKFFFAAMGGPSCSSHGNAPHAADPPASRTRAAVQAFFDAYAGRDVRRAVQLMTKTVTYGDCGPSTRREVSLAGRSQVKAWLRAQFRAGDTFTDVQVAAVAGTGANVATVHAKRLDREVLERGSSAVPVTLRLNISHMAGEKIAGVIVVPSSLACTHQS